MLSRFSNSRLVFRMEEDDLLGSMHVGDDGVVFGDDLGLGGGQTDDEGVEKKTLTTEEQLAEANAKLAKYKSLDFLAEAVEKDPSRIHDLRAAAAGKPVTHQDSLTDIPEAPRRPKADPNAPKTVLEAIQRLSQEERDKLNLLATEKPAEYQAALADLSAKIHIDQFRESAQPLVEGSVNREISDFKLSKADEKIYRHAVPYFDREMRDFDRNEFYNMPEATRKRQLELRWSAAKAAAYDAAASKAMPRSGPARVGGGSSGGGSAGGRIQTSKASDDINELAARSGLKPGQLDKIMKEVNS